MLAANFDITIDRAAEYKFVLTVKNQAGDAVNIGSAAFYADIRDVTSRRKVVSFTPTILDSGVNGQVSLNLTEANTLTLQPSGNYVYDVFMRRSGVTERLIEGSVTVRDNVTKGYPIEPTA